MTETTITATSASYYRIRGISTVYATARSTSSAISNLGKMDYGYVNPQYFVGRIFFVFNTSTIPDGDTVSDVKMRLVCTQDNSLTNDDIQIVEYNWSAIDPLADANRETAFDGALAGSTYVTWRNTNGMSINTQYTSPSMTAAYVSKTGSTYYAIRWAKDYAGVSAPADDTYIYFGLPGDAADYRPALIVTHAAAGVSIPVAMYHYMHHNGNK